ncbi:uncharacterized protein LOC113118694 isoform X2 [Carassius auratus]|uniref:Uncharacterized protein LOC113118694 isoform X2 n=1 Tax=Carassius auratus TaxID=7957 RepID=A0A6P6REH5_CARAU|nr:uncharacterized protein LOC113118694 isoform X2 [Carassius auratus]
MKECKHSDVLIICGQLMLCQPANSYICDAESLIVKSWWDESGTIHNALSFSSPAEKPMAQGPPGGIFGILGVVVVAGLIVGVVATICMVYRRGKKPRTETDNDLTDLPPAHKPAPPPPKKKSSDMKGGLTSDEIQVVHLDKEDEIQKIPLQPPYYDMAQSESTAFTDKPNSGHKDCDVQYAELDTAALASSPSPRSSVHTGGDLVEYATIQPSSH